MVKLLFQLLKTLPSFQKLLAEWFAEERGRTEKALADYRLQIINQAATIMNLRADAAESKAKADALALRIVDIQIRLTARELELERLQNETQQRLKAVAAMDSESVFNATLDGAKPAAIVPGDSPATERQSATELRWNRS